MSYRSLPRRLGATALSVLAAVSLSVVGLAGVASATAVTSVSIGSGPSGVGDLLTATPIGTVTGYQWYDCTSSVAAGTSNTLSSSACSPITNATAATYTVTLTDVGSGPYITVTASDSTGPAYAQAASVVATGETVTIISGSAAVNQLLTAAPGSGTPSYQWYRCTGQVSAGYVSGTPGGANVCQSITGATSSTYTTVAADFGSYVTVTATLAPATTAAVAPSTVLVGEPAPVVLASPNLSVTALNDFAGTQTYALTLSAGFGNLYNYTATYQWYDCGSTAITTNTTTVPLSCYQITTNATGANATGAQYTFAASDAGQNVSVLVTVTNAAGSATLFAQSVGPVVTSAANTSTYPTFNANTSTGVSASSLGNWSGSPSPTSWTVTWYRCSGAGPASGSTTLNPACTTAIAGPTTYNVESPSPMPSYTFTAADNGDSVLMGVTAYNGVVSSYVAYSAASSVFTAVAPSFPVAPSITTGTVAVGNLLTVDPGTLSGAPQPTVTQYAWYYCTAPHTTGIAQSTATLGSGYSDCNSTPLSTSTTSATYSVPNNPTLVGNYILAVVTASNGVTSKSYVTAAVGKVTGPSAPSATIQVAVGLNGLATATPANLSGQPLPTASSFTYSWYDCSAAQAASTTPASSLSALNLSANCSSATSPSTYSSSSTYSITPNDVYLSTGTGGGLVVVAEVNTIGGIVYINSASSNAPLTSAPPSGGSVTVSGSGSLVTPFTATATWQAVPAPTITYQWYMCTSSLNPRSSVSGCSEVTGATGSTFAPTTFSASTPDAVVAATATNYTRSDSVVGTDTQYSSGTPLTPQSLVLTTYPSITVTPTPASVTTASTLSTSTGVWQGVPAPTFSYQWYDCPTIVANPGTFSSLQGTCGMITGATSASYVPSSAYVGNYFLVVVTGSNGVVGGNVSVYTASTTAALVATLSITSLSVTGYATVGSTLSAVSSVYSQTGYASAYQWFACTSPVTAATLMQPYWCTLIPGATLSTFIPTTTQTSSYLTVKETVTSGTSSASAFAASTALITTNIPGAPASVTAYAGAGQATVSWTTPTSGLAATSFTVTSNPGALTCTATTLTCVVTGLLYGTSYTFSVTSTNAYGTSAASVNSNAVMPTEAVPGAPTTVSATAGVLSATVTWTAAAQNGAVISLYTVTSSPGNLSCTTTITSCTVTGLAANTPYTFTVSARNAVGVGPSSYVSAAVSPRPNTPNGPVGISTKRGNHQLTISWSAGSANGATVTGYLVTASGGGASKTCSTTGYRCVVSGLTNGIPYAVSVVAQSTSGSSPAVNGPAMVPAGPPSAPSIFHSARGAGVIVVYFHAPAQNNGAPVAYYQYLISGRWTVQPLKGRLFIVLRGLARHHAYIVRVRAVSVGGASGASNYVRVITL